MVVYIEYLIANNFFITYLICDLTYILTLRKRSRKRIIIASLLSTVTAFAYLFLVDYMWLHYMIKAVLWVVLSLILFVKKQNLLISSFVFLLLTMLVGGALTFLSTLVSPAEVIEGRLSFDFPIGVIVLASYVTVFIVKRVHLALFRRNVSQDLICNVKMGINGKTLEFRGFVDTGNRLMDSKSGLPVVVVRVSAVINVFSPAMFANLIEKGRSGNCITYKSVTGGVNKIMLIYPEFCKIEGKKENVDVALGVSFSGFYGDYDLILPSSIV